MTAPYQSKLIPYEDYIRECRAKRWSYPQISAALLSRHGLKAAPSTIFHFVKVRARKRRLVELPAKPSPQQPQTTMANGFFEPKPANPTHEIRKQKWNVSPSD